MELNKNLTNTNRGKGMKTFKQHVKEGMDRGKYGAGNVGVETSDAVEDSVIGVHNIHDADVLKRVNAFVSSVADQEYIKPQFAFDKLKEKLERIGLTVSDAALEGDNGKVTAEVKQFGGRFGKDTDGSDINDDGISHKKEGGLKMEISYETLRNGTSKVYAKLV